MNKITLEKLTELFFTKVKGWEKGSFILPITPTSKVNGRYGYKDHNGEGANMLPHLHESLDLQEIWVVPELEKIKVDNITFDMTSNGWMCSLHNHSANNTEERYLGYAEAPTKALAQLEASLNALGVKI